MLAMVMEDIRTSPSPQLQQQQRPRLRASCARCAFFKVKCSKEKPTCARCAVNGMLCVYEAVRRAENHRVDMEKTVLEGIHILPGPQLQRQQQQRPRLLRASCQTCADSKVKCSKEKPTCARCARNGMFCVYQEVRRADNHQVDMETTVSNPSSRIILCQGQHLEIAHRNQLPFRYHGRIGYGASATVDEVEDEATGQRFAYKLFHKYYGNDLNKWHKTIRNEIDILKRLKYHPHMVQLFGTYACGRELGMLLLPVAEKDLQAYLQDIRDTQRPAAEPQQSVLCHAFGCLASGLSFIHKHTIRHKDIKPKNILIHNGRAIYTDFGISLDATDLDQTTTTGPPGGFTRIYCAPEVANHDSRNRKSDIFSLGCVFFEIMAALEPGFDRFVLNGSPYYDIVEDIREALTKSETSSSWQAELLHVFHAMLEPTGEDRIGADDLVHRLWAIQSSHVGRDHALFCDDCLTKVTTESTVASVQEYDTAMEGTSTLAEDMDFSESDSGMLQPRNPSYKPRMNVYDFVQLEIERLVIRPSHGLQERQEGYMYILSSLFNPSLVAIGYRRDVPMKLMDREQKCNHPIDEFKRDTTHERILVKFAAHIEHLVRTELRYFRALEHQCNCRDDLHGWYHTTPEQAAKVIDKFASWMAKDPYFYDGKSGTWKLKEIRQQDMKMLRQPIKPEWEYNVVP